MTDHERDHADIGEDDTPLEEWAMRVILYVVTIPLAALATSLTGIVLRHFTNLDPAALAGVWFAVGLVLIGAAVKVTKRLATASEEQE